MENPKFQWRSYIKIAQQNGKNSSQIQTYLKTVFGNKTPCYQTIRTWHKNFSEIETEISDKPKGRPPNTAINDRNISRVKQVIEKDRRFSIR
jgi:hypothetical protein